MAARRKAARCEMMNLKARILSVGRGGRRPEQGLFDDYIRRIPWTVELIEIAEPRDDNIRDRRRKEGEKLLAAIPDDTHVIALDASGRELTSRKFAAQLEHLAENGINRVDFLIGGADGLDESVLARADRTISLGAMTWPHFLVRVMLAEQLYRAWSILAGHPYHRD